MSNPKDDRIIELYSKHIDLDILKSMQNIKYSTLNEAEKLHVCHEACHYMTEEMVFGQCKEFMNDIWYEPVLMMLRDLGYQTKSLRIRNWNNFQKKGRRFDPILFDQQAFQR